MEDVQALEGTSVGTHLAEIQEADSLYEARQLAKLEKRKEVYDHPPMSPFGISVNTINILSRNPLGVPLKLIYSGIQNLEIPVPMLARMNADEIAAKYAGAALLKQDDSHLGNPEEFLKLISRLDEAGYPSIGRYVKKWHTKFPRKSGEQRKRLSGLGEAVQKAFTDSFLKPEVHVPTGQDAFDLVMKIFRHYQIGQMEVDLQ